MKRLAGPRSYDSSQHQLFIVHSLLKLACLRSSLILSPHKAVSRSSGRSGLLTSRIRDANKSDEVEGRSGAVNAEKLSKRQALAAEANHSLVHTRAPERRARPGTIRHEASRRELVKSLALFRALSIERHSGRADHVAGFYRAPR